MASIRQISVAVPQYRYDNFQVAEAGRCWLAEHPERLALFERFLSSAQTENRNFCLPITELLSIVGMKKRGECFAVEGPKLGIHAARQVLERSETLPTDISSSIFTSCSCPSIPAIDVDIIQQIGISPLVRRVPIYQPGCAGGMAGLSLARVFAQNGEQVLLTSVELCSLVFQPRDLSNGHLVGSAIFGDGAASVVIGPEERGLVFADSRSELIPETQHIMGYDIKDSGSHLRLDKNLPQILADKMPQMVEGFLSDNSLTIEEVDWWLFHPGGVKILSYLEQAFSLPSSRCDFARRVLVRHGNLSSASVLFVIDDFLKQRRFKVGDKVLLLGVGPGLTIEQVLFQIL